MRDVLWTQLRTDTRPAERRLLNPPPSSHKQVVHRQACLGNGGIGVVADAEGGDHRGQDACLARFTKYTLAKSMKFHAIWLKYNPYHSQIGEKTCDLAKE